MPLPDRVMRDVTQFDDYRAALRDAVNGGKRSARKKSARQPARRAADPTGTHGAPRPE